MPFPSSDLHPTAAPDVNPSARTSVLDATARHAREYLEGVHTRPVAPPTEAVSAVERLREPLPLEPASPESVLELLARFGSPATVANSGGRFFGFVNGGCVPAALAAAWLVSTWDQNAAMRVQSPVAITLEETALEWVRQMLGIVGWMRRRGGYRGHHGQFLRPGCRPPCAAGTSRVGRGERRPVRSAAPHCGDRRGSPQLVDQGSGHGRAGAQPRGARAGRRAGTHARRWASASH